MFLKLRRVPIISAGVEEVEDYAKHCDSDASYIHGGEGGALKIKRHLMASGLSS